MPLYVLFTPGQPGAHQPKFADALSDAEALEWAELQGEDGKLWRVDAEPVTPGITNAVLTGIAPPAETRPIKRGRAK